LAKITLTINDQKINCSSGASILEAAQAHGVKIPTLCHHPDLKPYGACRLCIVEDETSGKIVASCVTPAASDMVIRTDTPRIIKHRRNIIRLMMAEHPESCIICSKGNRCQLRQIAAQLGVGHISETGCKLYPMPNYKPLEDANPYIVRDLSKCILCGKCIRADHELVVVGAIDYNHRGFRSRPATVFDRPLEKSNCTFCGTCVAVCPTGALSAKNDRRYQGAPERESFAVCGLCGAGCALSIGVVDDTITDVQPSSFADTPNGVTLCAQGRFHYEFLNAENRLTEVKIRKNGELQSASWDEVVEYVATRLISIKDKHGSDNIALLGAAKGTNEENYLFQKIARVLLQTNNVDNGGRTGVLPLLSLIDVRTGGGYRINPLAWLEKRAELILVIGQNPTQALPVAGYYLKRSARKGIPMIVASSEHTELANFASLWLQHDKEGELHLIQGLATLICKENGYDDLFINHFTRDFDKYQESLTMFNHTGSGIEQAALQKAWQLIKGRKVAIVVCQDVFTGKNSAEIGQAIYNLSLMTGSLGSVGGGIYLLAQTNNQVGAYDMGTIPDALPGRMPLNNAEERKKWEQIWETSISSTPGLNSVQILEHAARGQLQALWLLGENPFELLPDAQLVRKALERTEFVIVQGTHADEVMRYADVVLPGAAFSEKGGSFTNIEGRVQNFTPAIPPLGNAKPDWEILNLVLARLGYPIDYDSYQKIQKEIRYLIPMYAGLNGRRQTWLKEISNKKLFHADGKGERIAFACL